MTLFDADDVIQSRWRNLMLMTSFSLGDLPYHLGDIFAFMMTSCYLDNLWLVTSCNPVDQVQPQDVMIP
jgi:hypothetical protein